MMDFHRRPNFKYSTPLSVLGVRLPVLKLAFECMDVLSFGNMLPGDPPLPAYTWTQKASTSPRMQLEGPRSCGSGRCDRKVSVAPAGSKREQHRFGEPRGLAKPVSSVRGPYSSSWHSHLAFLSYTASQRPR